MRPAVVLAGILLIAAAGMAVAAFAGRDDPSPAPRASATPAAAPAPAAAPSGLAVWVREGCGGCHTLAAADAHGTVGPDLGSSLRGMPASYVKESIVAPQAAVAPGYSAGMMPEDYAQRIRPADLDRLVTFLLESAPD